MRSAVITLVAGRHSHLAMQRRGLLAGAFQPDLHIVVSMNDPPRGTCSTAGTPRPDVIELRCPPGPLPLARARNTGAQRALRAGADLLVFLDVDCIPGPRLVAAVPPARRERGLPRGAVRTRRLPAAARPRGYQLSALADLGRPHPARPVPPEAGVGPAATTPVLVVVLRRPRATCGASSAASASSTPATAARTPTSASSPPAAGSHCLGRRRLGLPPVPPAPGSAGGAPRRHPPQRDALPPTLGLVADDRLAARVRAARAHCFRRTAPRPGKRSGRKPQDRRHPCLPGKSRGRWYRW